MEKIYEMLIDENPESDLQVDFIALVDRPAIKKDFLAFRDQFVEPKPGEHENEFIPRCIAYHINEGQDQSQAAAICYDKWKSHFAALKISFDYDGTLSTAKGKELAKKKIAEGNDVYIISARDSVDGMLSVAAELGIPESRVYATGSNNAKIEKIQELDINKHYDNNTDVVHELSSTGQKFDSWNDYPEAAINNAKRALKWAEEHGWGNCGEQIGKLRANQIANRENLTRDTIARISGFRRHQQNKDVPYSEGCGGLMWDAWGGTEMIDWAERKLKQIDRKTFQIQDEEKRIISGPIMVANQLIDRYDEQNGAYKVFFSKDTIRKIAIKMAQKGFQNNVNLMHDGDLKLDGVTLFEVFQSDKERGIPPMKGFEDLPDGSLFGSMYVDNDGAWQLIKADLVKGFSVEGDFGMREVDPYEAMFSEIVSILNSTKF